MVDLAQTPRRSRTVVPHLDDLAASHGANAAFLELAAAGRITCGSAIVPGAWFAELAEAARADPALDIGVHLTLTSEWRTCRWAPISTTSRTSGLIDDEGYFWADVAGLRAHLVPEAAEAELRAQIERALAAGIRPTHIDAHMGAAWLPELLPAHVRLARDYGLFPVLPRSVGRFTPDPDAYAARVSAFEAEGGPVVGSLRGTLAVEADALASGWDALIDKLPTGVTHLALHATAPGDFTAMSPQHAPWRFREYAFLRDGALQSRLDQAGVGVTSTRALQTEWLTRRAQPAPEDPSQSPGSRSGSSAWA